MAGTLFGVPLSQQIGPDGQIASGALVYFYQANTSTPVNSYSDFALSDLNTWPLECDSAGRVPQFWLDDGSYRLRITTAAGVEMVDEASITAIGASDGGSGSGGGAAVASENTLQTGDVMWQPVAGTKTGWIRLNGRTISNGSGGGTERANSDTSAVFQYLWNNFSNSFCAVGGGRGASAEADFNANKAIATLDMRSKGPFGLGDMGNSAAGITGESTIAATAIGASTYTVAQANLPNVTLSSTGLAGGLASKTITNGTDMVRATGSANADDAGSGFEVLSGSSVGATISVASSEVNIFGTVPLGGSGTDLDILPPMRVGTWYMKC